MRQGATRCEGEMGDEGEKVSEQRARCARLLFTPGSPRVAGPGDQSRRSAAAVSLWVPRPFVRPVRVRDSCAPTHQRAAEFRASLPAVVAARRHVSAVCLVRPNRRSP